MCTLEEPKVQHFTSEHQSSNNTAALKQGLGAVLKIHGVWFPVLSIRLVFSELILKYKMQNVQQLSHLRAVETNVISLCDNEQQQLVPSNQPQYLKFCL